MKKPLKKTFISLGLIILMGLSIISMVFFAGCDGTIDPYVSFNSLEKLQAVLSEDFYFFDFDDQIMQAGSYSAETNTLSLRRRQKGDFEYIGYEISYIELPIIQGHYKAPFCYASAVSGKNLDGLVDELRRNVDSNITDEQIIIDGIECIIIYRPNMYYQLYFMIENIRYCFKMSKEKTEFLSLCESAILSRHQNI